MGVSLLLVVSRVFGVTKVLLGSSEWVLVCCLVVSRAFGVTKVLLGSSEWVLVCC